jgi:hypothetical protein
MPDTIQIFHYFSYYFLNAKQPYTTVKGIVIIPTEVYDEMLLILVFFLDWYIIYTESVTQLHTDILWYIHDCMNIITSIMTMNVILATMSSYRHMCNTEQYFTVRFPEE